MEPYSTDSSESVEYGSIDIDGTYLDEVDDSGSGEADVITGVTQSVTEEVEEVHRVVKYFSLLPYMLKPPSLITQGFNQNKKAHENIFNRVCNFGAQEECRNGRIPSVTILMLISAMIKTVWSIQPIWNVSQVI